MAPSLLRLVVVEGTSMAPGLLPGDRLLVLALRARPGDVVALRDPRDGRVIVKRVAAVEGDAVTVLGDDADRSTDSRTFGPVARSALLGRAVYRYAPADRVGGIPSRRA
jgi:nickel-type superoxide dismutase maturation protease